MARPPENRVPKTLRVTESERANAAKLAANVAALSAHLEPRSGQSSVRANSKLQPSAAKRLRSRVVYWLACLVAMSLVAVAVLRITWRDGTHFLIWLNAFTRYVYLPAYICLAWALWKRHWILVVANLALVCFHV